MSNPTTVRVFGIALTATALLTSTLVANAADQSSPLEIVPLDQAVVAPDLLDVLSRDFTLTRAQAQARYEQEAAAAENERRARSVLGDSFGGAWFDATTGRLVVHTTDVGKAEVLRGPEVEIRAVAHSLSYLDGVKNRLDSLAGNSASAAISGWYVSIQNNDVVIEVNRTADGAAGGPVTDFLATVTTGDSAVRVVDVKYSPRTYATVVGGYAFDINMSARCSIGFAVTTGFVTAGHCGQPGDRATTPAGEPLGAFAGSVFPELDMAWVRTAPGVRRQGYVYDYNGNYREVRGSVEMPVGASVCRSGSTTGMRCGTILIKNQTVNYPQGTVNGLTLTSVCSEPGDSGGPWLSYHQAQGVTSGGAGDCAMGGITFFQPVNPILSRYGLTLVTA